MGGTIDRSIDSPAGPTRTAQHNRICNPITDSPPAAAMASRIINDAPAGRLAVLDEGCGDRG